MPWSRIHPALAIGLIVWFTSCSAHAAGLPDASRRFQAEQLITAEPFSFIFNAGQPPRIVWRDLAEVQRLGCDGRLTIRWFDAQLNEAAVPDKPGRWGAYIEGTAPNGTPVRRAMTFYCRPPGFFLYGAPDLRDPLAYQPGPIPARVWREHADEISTTLADGAFKAFNDSEAGAILIAGLTESKARGRRASSTQAAAVLNDDFHLALKLKAQGLHAQVRPLKPARKRARPAPVLRGGSPAEAGVRADAKNELDELCREWARQSNEPFVTLVARHGVIVTHEAFGRDKAGRPVDLDYRGDVASITKCVTAMLFSQFVDQDLIRLDHSVATVFPDYPKTGGKAPTFRQCLTHTSGLSGHGDWGGSRNPHLENIILNAIDVNRPGQSYNYSGMGFDLTAKAMEIVSGRSFIRLYHDRLFEPLGIGDVPMSNASSGAQFTARQLAVIAQYMANRGSYGELELVSPETFRQLLPEPLGRRYPGIEEIEGIGMHWMKGLGPRTIGHGSLSSTIFLVDLDRDLVVVQLRRAGGPEFAEWSSRFFKVVLDAVDDRPERSASSSAR
jgi:CubicO group peptidase (beta-lactamase class C family)